MSAVLDEIHQEHKTMGRLLGVLEEQIDLFAEGRRPDYELIKEIVDYFLTVPNLCHHPKENLILQKLHQRAPEVAQSVGDLEEEHEEISRELGDFAHAVVNVLMEMEIPRDAFVKLAREFIETEHNHMVHEEEVFMPTARKHLTDEDWTEVEQHVARLSDPLRDADGRNKFSRLAERLVS